MLLPPQPFPVVDNNSLALLVSGAVNEFGRRLGQGESLRSTRTFSQGGPGLRIDPVVVLRWPIRRLPSRL
jgi:hypothetical protein